MVTRALLLGFNDFGHESDMPPLESAKNNARLLRALLTHERAGVKALDDENIVFKENLSAKKARSEIKSTIDICNENRESFLLYITGHGLMANISNDRDRFVVPTRGATIKNAFAGDVDSCLNFEDEILKELKTLQAPNTTIILDCCNSKGAISDTAEMTQARSLDFEEAPKFNIPLAETAEKYAIIVTAGSGQSAWETKWACVSPLRKGLREKYESLGLSDDTTITNFVGALVDVWSLSDTKVPVGLFDELVFPDDPAFFRYEVAMTLRAIVNQTSSGLVSISSGANGAAKLLQIMDDPKIRQDVSVNDPNKIASNLPFFRLPSDSREEKLHYLEDYIESINSVTDATRSKLVQLVNDGKMSASKASVDRFEFTSIELEDRLYEEARKDRNGAYFVEEFLLNGISDSVNKEVSARTRDFFETKKLKKRQSDAYKLKASQLQDDLQKLTRVAKSRLIYLSAFLVAALLFFSFNIYFIFFT